MESYGFYSAAKNTFVVKPEYLCVKAVADFCNGDKESGLHEACSLMSATIVHHIATELWKFD
jgi:hypothetical protein